MPECCDGKLVIYLHQPPIFTDLGNGNICITQPNGDHPRVTTWAVFIASVEAGVEVVREFQARNGAQVVSLLPGAQIVRGEPI